MTGTSRATAAASRSAARGPRAARMRPAGGVEEEPLDARRRGRRGRGDTRSPRAADASRWRRRRGRWRTFQAGAPSARRSRDVGFGAAELDDVRVDSREDRGEARRRGVRGDRHDPRRSPAAARRPDERGPGPRLRRARAPAACPARGSARSHRRRPGPRRGRRRASVTPQIFTNGRRATLAGSSGGRRRRRTPTAAAGSADRTSASPTSARVEALAPASERRSRARGRRTRR